MRTASSGADARRNAASASSGLSSASAAASCRATSRLVIPPPSSLSSRAMSHLTKLFQVQKDCYWTAHFNHKYRYWDAHIHFMYNFIWLILNNRWSIRFTSIEKYTNRPRVKNYDKVNAGQPTYLCACKAHRAPKAASPLAANNLAAGAPPNAPAHCNATW